MGFLYRNMVGKWSKHRREAKNEIKEIPMKIRLQMKKVKQKRLAASLIREMKSRLLPAAAAQEPLQRKPNKARKSRDDT